MGYNVFFVVIGMFALLALAAGIIRVFNHSKTTLQWFSYLLKQTGVILFYILFLDLQLLVLIGAIFVVWVVAYYSLTWGETNLSQFWNYILISLSFIYFLLWLWWTGTKNFYRIDTTGAICRASTVKEAFIKSFFNTCSIRYHMLDQAFQH